MAIANEVVCIDLNKYKHNKVWILHLINGDFRYSASCLVGTKNKGDLDYLFWITISAFT